MVLCDDVTFIYSRYQPALLVPVRVPYRTSSTYQPESNNPLLF
jgi:hypothetical protein